MIKKDTHISDSFMYRIPNYSIENLQKVSFSQLEKLDKKDAVKLLMKDDFFYK